MGGPRPQNRLTPPASRAPDRSRSAPGTPIDPEQAPPNFESQKPTSAVVGLLLRGDPAVAKTPDAHYWIGNATSHIADPDRHAPVRRASKVKVTVGPNARRLVHCHTYAVRLRLWVSYIPAA
jgi:hypothetical protein